MGLFSNIKEMISGPKVDYAELLANGAVVIDVRSPGEFYMGNKKGSLNIPLQDLAGKVNKYKNKEVILVCQSGMRAASAKGLFEKAGIKAYNAGNWKNV